jgi:hypothetical protein
LQRRQKNKLSLLAAGSFYNTHHNGKHLFTYLPSMALMDLRASHVGQTHPQQQACLGNYETSVYGSSVYILSFGPFYWIFWHVGVFVNLIRLSGLILVGVCGEVHLFTFPFALLCWNSCHRAPSFNVTGWFWACIWL